MGQASSVLAFLAGNPKLVALAAALAVLAIAAAVVAVRPAFLFEAKADLKPIPDAIARRLPGWRLAFVGLGGSPQEHTAEARRLFLADNPEAYRSAEEEYKKAIVLNPYDAQPVAGLVEAFAVGRGPRADK